MYKYRHEIKYLISKNMAEILKRRLELIMEKDKNGEKGYLIRSLYFDTPSSRAYYEKIDGTPFRSKYRIRVYNQDEKFIRLERKLKHNNMTAKEQTIISKELCYYIINNRDFNLKTNDKLLNRFLFERKIHHLRPSVIVDYYRLAFTYPISDVRITFDYNIKSGLYNYDLFDYTKVGFNILDENELVLEVKYNEVLPEMIATILQTVPLERIAFSKFANCRKLK